MSYIVNNSAVDYSISLKFCTEFKHMTTKLIKVKGHEVKGQGHSVT